MAKPTLSARSLKWVLEIDYHICRYDVRGPFERFHDVASDSLDGHAFLSELDDLIKRQFLDLIVYGRGEVDRLRTDRSLCGSTWSVNPTPKLIKTFWPERVREREGA